MMQARRETMKPCCWLWLGAVAMMMMVTMETTSAYNSFCERPANMEICWFNKINKRFLRFGRGDPFLRIGRRSQNMEDLEDGFLRFGRSLSRPSLFELLASEGAVSRKRRDVSAVENEATGLQRSTRDVKDGGFLRFGRAGGADADEGVASKRGDVPNGDREYLRFGRAGASQFPRWGKRYLRFGRGSSEGFLRFGKRFL